MNRIRIIFLAAVVFAPISAFAQQPQRGSCASLASFLAGEMGTLGDNADALARQVTDLKTKLAAAEKDRDDARAKLAAADAKGTSDAKPASGN